MKTQDELLDTPEQPEGLESELTHVKCDLTSPRVFINDALKLNLKQVTPGTPFKHKNSWLTPREPTALKTGKLKPLKVNHSIMSRNCEPELTKSVSPCKLKFHMPDPKKVLKSKCAGLQKSNSEGTLKQTMKLLRSLNDTLKNSARNHKALTKLTRSYKSNPFGCHDTQNLHKFSLPDLFKPRENVRYKSPNMMSKKSEGLFMNKRPSRSNSRLKVTGARLASHF